MNKIRFWKKILGILDQDETVVLVVIIDQIGSAPNSPGAKMYVAQQESHGTVGGGISEHDLIEKAKEMIRLGSVSVEKIYMKHEEGKSEGHSGMICSGSQTFALIPLSQHDLTTVEKVLISYQSKKPGKLSINKEGIHFIFNNSLKTMHRDYKEGEGWVYEETTGIENNLFIIGGGHVSLSLSKVVSNLGFHITVIDDRKDLSTMVNNTYAHEKRIIDDYDIIEQLIPEGENIYVCIMTFGHQQDETVLENLIYKKVRYIGMMASKAKKKQIFSNLIQRGIPVKLLDAVYSPIGVSIKSITPDEIAISIAAELIKVKNNSSTHAQAIINLHEK